MEGILATSAPYVAVMDADLQHDERILPTMLARLKNEQLDIVVGSRHVDGGSLGNWDAGRVWISQFATRLSRAVVPADLSDPMSGFFLMTRTAFMGSVRNLSALGFKILVDLFASSNRPLRFAEVGYTFRTRQHGESKLDGQVAWQYAMLLLDKTIGRWIPVRFVAFSMVGGTGVLVHMMVLTAMYKSALSSFTVAQATATGIAMVFNFAVNNAITYRDQKLSGLAWFRGLLSFVLACSIGAVANVGIADYLFQRSDRWFLAGLAGILVGAVWNYSITAIYTWRRQGT
jgi:dolichol-phosphate mannosyltransferase